MPQCAATYLEPQLLGGPSRAEPRAREDDHVNLYATTPAQLLPLWRLWTGYEADAELICVTGREKVQAIDHAVVTTYE
jgi:hypothetical protein